MPQQSTSALVEITKAEIRMGKEFNTLQNILRDWYFTCYTIGTLIFMMLYASLWLFLEGFLNDHTRELQSKSRSDGDVNTEGNNCSQASERGTPRRSDFSGTENPQDHEQNNDWDDIFYDAPIFDGPDGSGG